MLTRSDILSEAVDKCMKELYSYAQPHIEWNEFIDENKHYSKKYKEWEEFKRIESKANTTNEESVILCIHSDWKGKSLVECIGPRPYEFYYLPKVILKDIVDNYVYAYKIDNQQELLDTIETLKNYCKEPIVDKYIDDWTDETGFHHPGYRSYDHPDNLEKKLQKIFDDKILPDICKQYNKQYNLQTTGIESSVSKAYSQIFQDKFFEFLDMAGKFFNWNGDLNSFNVSVYLGSSPNSNKEAVIKNWKEYRGEDIEINEEEIKKEYYGEEELD